MLTTFLSRLRGVRFLSLEMSREKTYKEDKLNWQYEIPSSSVWHSSKKYILAQSTGE